MSALPEGWLPLLGVLVPVILFGGLVLWLVVVGAAGRGDQGGDG